VRRVLVADLQLAYRVSIRRACKVVMCHSSVLYYQPTRSSDLALRARIKEIAQTRIRYGYQHIHILLRREAWCVNQSKPADHAGHFADCYFGLPLPEYQ